MERAYCSVRTLYETKIWYHRIRERYAQIPLNEFTPIYKYRSSFMVICDSIVYMIIKLMHFEGFESPFFTTSFDDALAYVRKEISDDMRHGIFYETTPRYDPKGINNCPVWELSQICDGAYGHYHWQIWEVMPIDISIKFATLKQNRNAMKKRITP